MTISRSKFIFKAPFNSLSFGQVSTNLAREMWKKKLDVSIFPIGNGVDLSSYAHLEGDFFSWINQSIKNRYEGIDRDTKCIQLWHLNGSDSFVTPESYLLTFHETDSCTKTEVSISKLHKKVFFSSSFSKNIFQECGVSCDSFFLGFDENIEKKQTKILDDSLNFSLIGKWENRKNTEKIIFEWSKRFGNNPDYRLTCLVDNPFFQPEMMSNLKKRALQGGEFFNVTFLPFLKSNSEVYDLYNLTDIDLSGLSSAEGWNLPAFNSTCLGKWSCVLNHTSHKDWANEKNSILINPESKQECYDDFFFKKGADFNQGKFYHLSQKNIQEAFDKSIIAGKSKNENGLKLKECFTFKNMLENILNKCEI